MNKFTTTTDSIGRTYYHTEARGIAYYAYEHNGEWCTRSLRKSLGRSNVGTYRTFATVEKLAEQIKAFSDLPGLLQIDAVNPQ